jgi:hypothetical protein
VNLEGRLNADPAALRPRFEAARPFPHVVVDGLFPDDVLEAVRTAFPPPEAEGWRRFDNSNERKLGSVAGLVLQDPVADFLAALNAAPILEFLEASTGIDGLIPDPYFGGGGLHQILPGGFLRVHTDFNWHPKLRLHRRLNVLVYLNRDWREEYGGHLELWNAEMTRAEERILPVFNRTVVFATGEASYHGHPTPLACPAGMTRKSVSLYYYTSERPERERAAPHDTVFRAERSVG